MDPPRRTLTARGRSSRRVTAVALGESLPFGSGVTPGESPIEAGSPDGMVLEIASVQADLATWLVKMNPAVVTETEVTVTVGVMTMTVVQDHRNKRHL